MFHYLQVVLVHVNEKGIIDARESHPLGVVATEHRTAREKGFVASLEATPVKVYDEGSGLLPLDRPEVEHAAVEFLAVAKVAIGRIEPLGKTDRPNQGEEKKQGRISDDRGH